MIVLVKLITNVDKKLFIVNYRIYKKVVEFFTFDLTQLS
ncbi:hypothetical protein BH23BAC2_BH23BAC2_23560 [soil metagenome]